MNNAEFQLQGVGDPRLAVHATSPLPAWLWSIDGTRVLWANPVGAQIVRRGQRREPFQKDLRPGRSAPAAGGATRRTGCRRTGAIRLERLRGFGAALGIAHYLRLRAA